MTSPATPPPPDTHEVEALVRLYRKYAEEIAGLQAAQAAIRERFAAITPLGYALEVDGKPAMHSPPPRAFDEGVAVEIARMAGIPVQTREVVDTADLRERLRAAGKLDGAMMPGGGKPRVTLG